MQKVIWQKRQGPKKNSVKVTHKNADQMQTNKTNADKKVCVSKTETKIKTNASFVDGNTLLD